MGWNVYWNGGIQVYTTRWCSGHENWGWSPILFVENDFASSLLETESEVTDDYWHRFPLAHCVVEGHYLEIYKETISGGLYYIDNPHKALISAFSIVGNYPELPRTPQKKSGKIVEMFSVDHDMHQALLELVISEYVKFYTISFQYYA